MPARRPMPSNRRPATRNRAARIQGERTAPECERLAREKIVLACEARKFLQWRNRIGGMVLVEQSKGRKTEILAALQAGRFPQRHGRCGDTFRSAFCDR